MLSSSAPSNIPVDHTGLYYTEFLSSLISIRGDQRYLEIGVCEGDLLSHIKTDIAVGVDPRFNIKFDVMNGKKHLYLHQMTSDHFFRDESLLKDLGGAPDFIFLDGMHTFEYLLRDFYNSEAICKASSLIAIHDCLPLSVEMAHRSQEEANKLTIDSKFPYAWTGDVWKIIPILKKYRPDLDIVCIDSAPTGIVFVTGLDSSSVFLKDHYLSIVNEFREFDNSEINISEMYSSILICKAEDVIANFDHSLFFRI